MSKSKKSLGQIDYEAGANSLNYKWDQLWSTARARCEKGAQAVKRAVLREVKPQLDAGRLMRNTLEHIVNHEGSATAKRYYEAAATTLANVDELLKGKAAK